MNSIVLYKIKIFGLGESYAIYEKNKKNWK